ncbi:Peroxisomal N(1)-acetyl-spermine/spermidine oxidase, partial [Anthophora quadrimaculata]
MSKGPKIIIIGAGAAGISAAAGLIKKGLENVVILEAKNRIGGRINTVEFSDNVVELGAQWVHGELGNIVFNLASQHKLLDSSKCFNDFDAHIFVTANGEILPKEETVETLRRYYDISENISDEVYDAESYGEYFVKQMQHDIVNTVKSQYRKLYLSFYKRFEENPFTTRDRAEELLNWMHKFDNSIQCSDSWFDVSAKEITNYWTCEGDHVLNWKYHGYKTLFDLLSQKIPNSKVTLPIMEKIEFNKDVYSIDYTSSDNIIVKTKDGSKYTASHVICTVSLGVLKERHLTMFTPFLPENKQLAIKGLNIGSVNKVFLEFPHRWWQEDCAGFSLIWSKEDEEECIKCHGQEYGWLCDVFGFIPVDYQPRVLCTWISGKCARQMELLSDNDVSNGLYLLLDMFLSKAYNIPKFDKMIRSSWYTDEHFRGCYTFKSTETDKLNVKTSDLAGPIVTAGGKPIILFAGEATHEHYYSTVHGAVETGFREANRILEYHRTCGSIREVINGFQNKVEKTPDASNQVTARTKLAIVGAGIAGLAAAKTLEDVNFTDYLLIEAQNEVGGRINSVPWNDTWIEYGAQFVHGDQSQLAQLCYQHDLLADIDYRDGQGIFIRSNGRKVDEALVEEIDDLIRNTLEDCEDYVNRDVGEGCENIGMVLRNSLNQHLHQKNDSVAIKNIKKEIFDWNLRFLNVDNSCYTLDDLSTKYWGKFKFTGGSEYLSFKS